MRIALYTRVFPPSRGGMERFAEELAGWLHRQGHRVTVLTRTPAGAGGPEEPRPYSVVRRPPGPMLIRHLRRAHVVHVSGLSVRGVAASLAAGRRPVVTHHGYQAVCPTGLALTEGNAPCTAGIGPCETCPGSGVGGRVEVPLHRLAARAAAANVTISQHLDARVSLPGSRIVYDPVPDRAFDAPGNGEQVADRLIAFAGRLVEEKGLDLLLEALPVLSEVRLEVAGDGPMRETWETLSQRLGVGDRIAFHGHVPFQQVAEMYSRATVVCVPSRWNEPFGYAVAEAMALGRPVVATPRGAFPELLADRRGFVADKATPSALADALERALGDHEERRSAARCARAFAEDHLSSDKVGDRYLKIYREAAA